MALIGSLPFPISSGETKKTQSPVCWQAAHVSKDDCQYEMMIVVLLSAHTSALLIILDARLVSFLYGSGLEILQASVKDITDSPCVSLFLCRLCTMFYGIMVRYW